MSNVETPTTATPMAARTIPPATTLRSVFLSDGVMAASATSGFARAAAVPTVTAAVSFSVLRLRRKGREEVVRATSNESRRASEKNRVRTNASCAMYLDGGSRDRSSRIDRCATRRVAVAIDARSRDATCRVARDAMPRGAAARGPARGRAARSIAPRRRGLERR